jgi:serine/threonine-protein kinase 24/25/MST4
MVVLHHMHTMSTIHRNVSAACIKFRSDGAAAVGCFELAASMTDGNMHYQSLVGYLEYLAPEIILCSAQAPTNIAADEASYSYAVDVWALGVLVFYAVTGDLPFGGNELHCESEQDADELIFHSVLYGDASYPRNMDSDARDFIAQCLVKTPDARPSVRDLLLHPFITKHLHWKPGAKEMTPDSFCSPVTHVTTKDVRA